MRIIRKQITTYLKELLEEQHKDTGQPRNKLIALELIRLALDKDTPDKLRLEAISMITDRIEGKAIQVNANADVTTNPFEGIDTAKLEALKNKLIEQTK